MKKRSIATLAIIAGCSLVSLSSYASLNDAKNLQDMDAKHPIFHHGDRVLELGTGQGFTTKVIANLIGNNGLIITTDIKQLSLNKLTQLNKIVRTNFILGDFTSLTTQNKLISALDDKKVEIIFSDLPTSDHLLLSKAWAFSKKTLRSGGTFVTRYNPTDKNAKLTYKNISRACAHVELYKTLVTPSEELAPIDYIIARHCNP